MEVTRKNFAELLPNITNNLQQSCFVGFDAEFTAILSSECFKHRLFDTNADRYNKLKTEVSKMLMTQVGLTMFRYDRDKETYISSGYTFHLCPQVFGDVDQSFIFQASTLKFLCMHNFDFNKFTYEGLPYLSKAEEDQVRENIKNKTMFQDMARNVTMEEERQLQRYCSEVSSWLVSSEEGTIYLDISDPVERFIVHNELRIRFPQVLTTDSLGNSNKILIYRNNDVEGATAAPMSVLEEKLLSHLLGFSQIIALLKKFNKPIIGHNIFLDILLLHNQFIGPLPKDYSRFKKNIRNMLPHVFDTKYISHTMAKKLTLDEVWKSNSLQDLYEFFAEGKCKKLQREVNQVTLSTPFNVKQTYHEAGWDSYCTGYCFIRLGHWAASEISGKPRPVGPRTMLAALAPFCNKVNVIRAAVPYMNLSGSDPPSHRPALLHVAAIAEPKIDVDKVASLLAAYGNIDVKRYGTRTALIAANTNRTVERILQNFQSSKEFRVSYYNAYKHSVASRMALWSGALITGSLMLYLVHRKMKVLA